MTTRMRTLFGPSTRTLWRQLSEEIGAKYVDGWRGTKVQAAHGDWTVTLDSYVVPVGKAFMHFTRMRAPYVNPEGFRFTIYRRSIFSGMGTWLGMQDIEVGDRAFDEEFIIKGTHEERVRSLFADPKVRELIVAQRSLHLTVKDDEGWFGASFPDGVDELHFAVPGLIRDLDRLKQLYELFAAVLDRLCAIGSAYDRDPRVAL
jgi:hypothetical protein